MLNIKDLKGASLKKDTGLKSIKKRYHNVDNFGFTIVNKAGEWFDMSGYFCRTTGKVRNIRFGKFSEPGFIIPEATYERVVRILKRIAE